MVQLAKTLFIDRDDTLIIEPEDWQVDSLAKLAFIPNVIPALLQLKAAGFIFVIVTNQNGIGSKSFPEADFWAPQNFMIDVFSSQGIEFADVLICPHFAEDNCECRKPKVGLVMSYIVEHKYDHDHSYVIGDNDTDVQLAEKMGIKGFRLGAEGYETWEKITRHILGQSRTATISRKTKETEINLSVDLDEC